MGMRIWDHQTRLSDGTSRVWVTVDVDLSVTCETAKAGMVGGQLRLDAIEQMREIVAKHDRLVAVNAERDAEEGNEEESGDDHEATGE